MASSVSILNNYDGQLFSFANKDLLMQGLLMKEGQYAQNKAKLKLTANELMGIDISDERPQDQEYLMGRIKEFEGVLQSHINSDLSNDYLVDQLVGRADEVVDGNVLNAVMSNYTRKSEMAKISQLKEEGKYSDKNFSVYNQRWKQYIDNPNVGAQYSGSTYVPYVDLEKRFTSESMLKKMKLAGFDDEFIGDVQRKGFYTAINKYKGTSPDRANKLRAFIDAEIGEDGRAQMAVDAVYAFGYGDNEEQVELLRGISKQYHTDVVSNLKERLEAVNIILEKGGLSASDREKYEKGKAELEDRLQNENNTDFDIVMDDGTGHIDRNKYMNFANNVITKKTKDDLFELTYMTPIWTDKKLDEVQAENMKYKMWSAEFGLKQRSHDLEERKFDFEVQKYLNEQTENPVVPNNIVLGGAAPVTNEEGYNIVQETLKERNDIISAFRNGMIDGKGHHWSKEKTAELMGVLNKTDNINDLVGTPIKLTNGENYFIQATDIPNLQKMKDMGVGNTGLVGGAVQKVGELMDWGNGGKFFKFDEVMSGNNMFKGTDYVMRKNASGEWELSKGKLKGVDANGSNFKLLVYKNEKGTLSEEEKATYDFYKYMTFASEKAGVFKSDEKVFLDQSFSSKYGNVAGMKAKSVYDLRKEAIDKDAYYQKSDNTGGYNIINKSKQLKTLNEKMKETLVPLTNMNEVVVNYVDAKTNRAGFNVYNNIKNSISGIPEDFKGNFTFEPQSENGTSANKFKVNYSIEQGSGQKKKTVVKNLTNSDGSVRYFTTAEMRGMGITVQDAKDTPYNSDYGEYAGQLTTAPSKKSGFFSSTTNAPVGSRGYYSQNVTAMLDVMQDRVRKSGKPNFDIYEFLVKSQSPAVRGQFTVSSMGAKGGFYGYYTKDDKGRMIEVDIDGLGNSINKSYLDYETDINNIMNQAGRTGGLALKSYIVSQFPEVDFH